LLYGAYLSRKPQIRSREGFSSQLLELTLRTKRQGGDEELVMMNAPFSGRRPTSRTLGHSVPFLLLGLGSAILLAMALVPATTVEAWMVDIEEYSSAMSASAPSPVSLS
jgi:hypothetical protein